jgi:ubiquinone/menaquinone biosynthesis C-methylase UbiE
MLLKARRRVHRAGLGNVYFTQASATSLPFKPATFDTVFLVAVLGEVPDPPACVAAVAAVLRPDGILSVTELPGDPDALSESDVREMAEASGLRCLERFPVRGGFTMNLRKMVGASDVARS